MPFRRIGLDQHLCRSRKIVFGHPRRSNHHDLANAPLVDRFKLFPNETDVVAAAGKAVDRSDRAIGSNALKGLFHLRISGIIITSNIEHLSLEPQTTRVRKCGLIVELTSRIFRVCDASQYQHHLPRVVLFRRRRLNRSGESAEGPTSRVAIKGTTVRRFMALEAPAIRHENWL